MNYKKWLISGIIIFLLSFIFAFFGPILGIYHAFDALKSNEGAAGIGVVSSALNEAIITSFIAVFGFLIGLILIAVGGVKAFRQSKSKV